MLSRRRRRSGRQEPEGGEHRLVLGSCRLEDGSGPPETRGGGSYSRARHQQDLAAQARPVIVGYVIDCLATSWALCRPAELPRLANRLRNSGDSILIPNGTAGDKYTVPGIPPRGVWIDEILRAARRSSPFPQPTMLPAGDPARWRRTAAHSLSLRARLLACLALAVDSYSSGQASG